MSETITMSYIKYLELLDKIKILEINNERLINKNINDVLKVTYHNWVKNIHIISIPEAIKEIIINMSLKEIKKLKKEYLKKSIKE